jgi:hypothetical protein
MRDSPLDLSRFVDATPGPTPEVRERLAARLQMLIESEEVGDKQPHGRWQRASWTHRAVVIAVAAAIVVVFFVPLPHVSLFHNLVTPAKVAVPTKLPVVDLSATPSGWVPVADGDVQISVPATWRVLYNSGCPTGSPPGEVLVDPVAEFCAPYREPRNLVWLTLLAGLGSDYKHRSVINGFSVYDDTPITYFVPSLRLRVSLSGPLAQRVLHTLTRSPRTVALATGPAPTVPSSWRSVTFAGLRFSVPAVWPITRTSGAAFGLGSSCATPGVAFPDYVAPSLLTYGVTLDTDTHFLAPPACPTEAPLNQPPMNGIQVDSGSRMNFQVALSFSTRCLHLLGLSACPATSPAYSILVLKVTVPVRSKPVYVSIGLAGNGMVARTILYSLRATPRSTSLARATTCAHNDKTFPARVWTQLVANGYMVCPITVKRVTPFGASEAVARDVKNGAIPSTLHPLLARVGSKSGGLVGQPRHSVYWVLIDMPQLASGGPAGSCGTVSSLRGFSLDLVNANTGKWVTSAEWWPQELSLTPAPQYRAAWQHREKAQEQMAKGVAACRRKHR